MSVVNAIPLIAAGDDGYSISRSLRFRSSASAYFNRTPASATNRKTWTWSGWVKRGALGSTQVIFQSYWANVSWFLLEFEADNTIQVSFTAGSAAGSYTTAVFRDPSAWYHIVLKVDTTQATAANRVMLYVNGTLQTFASTNYPAQNFDTQVNNAVAHTMGGYTSSSFFDGYMAEINFIDGQALTPSSFGEFSIYNQWLPKKYSGTYGTNGFYLPFTNNASTTTLGYDFSPQGNNWTTNNISVTAGSTYDSMTDVPTLTSATASNFAVVNPLKKGGSATITDGNLTVAINSNGGEQPANIGISNGKWYWEVSPTGSTSALGLLQTSVVPSASSIASGYHYYGGNGLFYTNVSGVTYGATYGNGDVIGVAVDLVNNQITFYKNNTSQGTQSIAAGEYFPDFGAAAALTNYVNFGQRPFTYTPPTGFLALNIFNL